MSKQDIVKNLEKLTNPFEFYNNPDLYYKKCEEVKSELIEHIEKNVYSFPSAGYETLRDAVLLTDCIVWSCKNSYKHVANFWVALQKMVALVEQVFNAKGYEELEAIDEKSNQLISELM